LAFATSTIVGARSALIGEHRIPKGKLHIYEESIRVPGR
jgi:hypothetical protein